MNRDPAAGAAKTAPGEAKVPSASLPIDLLGSLLGIPKRRRLELPAALHAGVPIRWLAFLSMARIWNFVARRLGQRHGLHTMPQVESQVPHLSVEQLEVLSPTSAKLPAHDASRSVPAFPPLIFQTWKSRHRLPADFAGWSDSLRTDHPGWHHVRWDDADNRGFIARHHGWFLPLYDTYRREILRADAVRYFFLFQFGGLYVDMDTECLRPLDGTFDDGADVWLGRMGSAPDFDHSIPNAMMAARPRQEFWLLVMFLLARNAREAPATGGAGVEAMTGPILLKQAHDLYVSAADRAFVEAAIRDVARHYGVHLPPFPARSRVRLLPAQAWYPIDWSNVIHSHLQLELRQCALARPAAVKRWLFPGSTLVTYWSHSWGQ